MSYNLKEIRKSRKLTQSELSKKSGVSRTIISKLENGEAITTTTKSLLALAQALDVTVDQIFCA